MKNNAILILFLFQFVSLRAQEGQKDSIAAQEFGKIVKVDGGRLDSNSSRLLGGYLIKAREVVGNIQKKSPTYPRPYIDFVNNSNLNAYSTKSGKQYFIAINTGTLEIIADVVSRLFAYNNTFEKIGNPAVEKNPEKIDLSAVYFSRTGYAPQTLFPYPIDSTRKKYAGILVGYLYKYLVLHEYGHIVNGHVGYRESCKQLPLKEIDNKSLGYTLTPLDSQTIEMDADSYATTLEVETIIEYLKHPKLVPIYLRPYYVNWQSAFRLWLTGVYIQWRLFFFLNRNSDLQRASHPLPAIRAFLIFGTAAYIFDLKYKTGLRKEIADIFVEVSNEVESAFAQMATGGSDYSHVQFMFSDDALRQGKLILKNWNHVRPLLRKYAYTPLAELESNVVHSSKNNYQRPQTGHANKSQSQ